MVFDLSTLMGLGFAGAGAFSDPTKPAGTHTVTQQPVDWAMPQVMSTLNGDYLGQGQGFDQYMTAAYNQINPRVNSAFSMAGQNGQAPLAEVAKTQALADSFAGLYNSERNRQIQAAGMGTQMDQPIYENKLQDILGLGLAGYGLGGALGGEDGGLDLGGLLGGNSSIGDWLSNLFGSSSSGAVPGLSDVLNGIPPDLASQLGLPPTGAPVGSGAIPGLSDLLAGIDPSTAYELGLPTGNPSGLSAGDLAGNPFGGMFSGFGDFLAGTGTIPAGALLGGIAAPFLIDQLFGHGDYPQPTQSATTSTGQQGLLLPVGKERNILSTQPASPAQVRAAGQSEGSVLYEILEGPSKGALYNPKRALIFPVNVTSEQKMKIQKALNTPGGYNALTQLERAIEREESLRNSNRTDASR